VMQGVGAGDQARRLLERAVGRERHPIGLQVVGNARHVPGAGKRHGGSVKGFGPPAGAGEPLHGYLCRTGGPAGPARGSLQGGRRPTKQSRTGTYSLDCFAALAMTAGYAAATRPRKSSTAVCSVPVCAVSAPVASSTAVAARFVSSIASVTVAMLPASSLAPLAACWTLSAMVRVEALCSSTAAAIETVKLEISPITSA